MMNHQPHQEPTDNQYRRSLHNALTDAENEMSKEETE